MEKKFDLLNFLPYLLNQAADTSGMEFQRHYKTKYNMLRTEWRILFHLGRYGDMTAKEICERSRTHKTKVSRAAASLKRKLYVEHRAKEGDRRSEILFLTAEGQKVYEDLSKEAQKFNNKLLSGFNSKEREIILGCLRVIAKL